jgi:antitoxin component HigA of HigAB toxin-antitoxin module
MIGTDFGEAGRLLRAAAAEARRERRAAMSPPKLHEAPSKSYMSLVRRFALAPIRDDAHLEAASRMLDYVLTLGEEDRGVVDYLDVLTGLVEAYEDAHVRIGDGTVAGALAMAMEGRGLTQTRLAKEVGIAQATISNVLRGVRDFTGPQAVRLGVYFSIDAGAFLPNPAAGPSPRHPSP